MHAEPREVRIQEKQKQAWKNDLQISQNFSIQDIDQNEGYGRNKQVENPQACRIETDQFSPRSVHVIEKRSGYLRVIQGGPGMIIIPEKLYCGDEVFFIASERIIHTCRYGKGDTKDNKSQGEQQPFPQMFKVRKLLNPTPP